MSKLKANILELIDDVENTKFVRSRGDSSLTVDELIDEAESVIRNGFGDNSQRMKDLISIRDLGSSEKYKKKLDTTSENTGLFGFFEKALILGNTALELHEEKKIDFSTF